MASRLAPSPVPRRLGPFHVVRALPPGGMADLYLVYIPPEGSDHGEAPGRGELRGDPRVLKVVQARFRDNARVAAMLRDEAMIGRRLRHRNLVRVLEAGELDDAGPYLLMAFIPGRDLVGLLRRCMEKRLPFPRDLGVHVCAEVARGLAHAHELRDEASGAPLDIVHCDVSPGNVMISPSGAVTLVDFGVARANLPLHCPDRGVAGKYNYMAPEQIRNEPLDRRTDLFSLGIILYELTVGERLFRGPAEAVMHKVLEEPIPAPRQRDRGYPAELEAIVLRALQREPEERYQSAAAMLADLQAYLARRVGTPAEAALSRLLLTAFARPELEALEALDGGEPATPPLAGAAEVRPAALATPASLAAVTPAPLGLVTPTPGSLPGQPSVPTPAPRPVVYEESAAFVFEPSLPSLPPRRPSGTTPRPLTPISLSALPASSVSPRPSSVSPRPAAVLAAQPPSALSGASGPALSASSARLPPPSEPSIAVLPVISSGVSPAPGGALASSGSPRPVLAGSLSASPPSSAGPLPLPEVRPSASSAAPPAPTAARDRPAPARGDRDEDVPAAPARRLDPVWIATGIAGLVLLAVLAYLAGQLLTRYQ